MNIYKYLFVLIMCFLSLPIQAEEKENIFMKMASQPYRDYAVELRLLYWEVDKVDSLQSGEWLEQLREVAQVTKRKNWELEARLFEITYRFREGFRDSPLNTYRQEEALRDLLQVSEDAQQSGSTYIYLRTLHSIMNFYLNLDGNYEMAFEYARLLNSKLEEVDAAQFLSKLYALKDISLMYYRFHDYEEAAFFLTKIIDDKEVALSLDLLQPALNDMGLVYRNHRNDLATSNSYFHKVLEIHSPSADSLRINRIWEAIAKGNLGYNHYLQKEDKKAIPLLEESYLNMVSFSDYHHASGSSIALADIYLRQLEPGKCRQYIDISHDLINRSSRKDRRRQLFPIISKYYTLTGNKAKALAYVDSTIQALEEYHHQYSALQLLRAEQRIHRMEQRAQEEELQTEKIRSNSYRNTVIVLAVAFLLLTVLFIYSLLLYRKRREAYRQLVRKAREWARQTTNDKQTKVNPELVKHLQKAIEEEQAYLLPNLTLEELAEKLHTDRSTLSQTVNQYTGKNFNNYINEYRIKESIRLIDTTENPSIDEIAFHSGFNNRISFYRAFKKITGISPTTYRRNKQE